jgi:hypothetical protein
MKVRDLSKGDTFHMKGGDRKYEYMDKAANIGYDNDTWVRCTVIDLPYLIDLDEEVERVNEDS